MKREYDVIVVGSGMAGLVSAVRALEFTSDVLVLEKAHRLGGTLPVTAGTLVIEPEHEPVIDVYEPVEEGIEWLEAHDVRLTVPDDQWLTDDAERIARIDPLAFIDRMQGLITDRGGEILRNTAMERITTGDLDEITGVIAHREGEGRIKFRAPSVVLATGGFSGNAELIERYFSNANLWNARHPWCTGDGFEAALDVGGRTTRGLSQALGGLRPAPPAQITEDNRRSATTVYRNKALIMNERGERFTDESVHVSGSTALVSECLKHIASRGYLILDHDVYESHTGQVANEPKIGSLVDGAKKLGAPVAVADTIEELGEQLSEMGMDGDRGVETIEAYNEAIRNDHRLTPPRKENRFAMDTPPFYAVAVEPSIVYIRGGLDVNHNAQVISKPRSTSNLKYQPENMHFFNMEPIPGLYAAGIEVGRDADHGYYHLGLSLGLATGRTAGKHAAEYAIDLKAEVA